ncbi:MAG: hypothetical protein ACREBF_00705 [Candidatus Micrarchaeales archaeon]
MRKNVCICCGNEVNGLEVTEDYVIKGIKLVKSKLNMKLRNNRLVWCKECYPKHVHASKGEIVDAKYAGEPVVTIKTLGLKAIECRGYEQRRKNYETRQMTYVGIGVIFAALGLIISPSLQGVLVSVILILFLYLLSLLNYTPKIASK